MVPNFFFEWLFALWLPIRITTLYIVLGGFQWLCSPLDILTVLESHSNEVTKPFCSERKGRTLCLPGFHICPIFCLLSLLPWWSNLDNQKQKKVTYFQGYMRPKIHNVICFLFMVHPSSRDWYNSKKKEKNMDWLIKLSFLV